MRKMKKLLLPLFALGAFVFNPAMAEVTIVTVSMQKLFDGYYKSTQANQRLDSVREQAMTEAQEKEQELQALVEVIRGMQEELQNPVLSDESKAEKQAELQAKAQEGQQKQAEFQQWNQQTMADLNQQSQNIRKTLIDEISKIVNEMALKDFSADLVLDTSDILGSGVPTVLFASDSLDITEKVLVKLNADAPNN